MKRRVAVVLVALLMVGAVVPAAVASGDPVLDAEQHGPGDVSAGEDEPKIADEAYIKKNGDAVLVYEETESAGDDSFGSESESTATGEFGVDVSAGLADMLIQDEVSSEVTGEGVAVLTPNRFEGNGSMAAPQPDALESMAFDLTSETSPDTQSVDASLDTTISTEDSEEAGYLGLLENAETSGTMTVTPDTFTLDGQGAAEIAFPMGEEAEQTFTIAETEAGYTVEVTQRKSVSSFDEAEWNSREAARQTLASQYVMAAESLGGEADLTIDSYGWESADEDGSGGTLDISYTVTYTGIEEAVSEQLVTSLTTDEDLDLDESEAEVIARDIRNVEFTRIHASYTSGSGSYNVEFDSEIGNYTAGANAAIRLQAASEIGSEAQVQRLRAKLAARTASDLKQTTEWSASIEPKDDTAELSASLTTDSENWDSYVGQLEERDIELGTTTMEAHVETDGDEISGTMSFSAERDGLVKKAVKPYFEAVKSEDSAEYDAETRAFVTAVRDAEFRKAKMNVSADGEQVTARAALAADNMSAIQPLLADTYGGTVTSMYGNTTDDGTTTTTYVHVEGLTGDDPSEVAVRDTAVVDEETEVAMPGTWDREFPRLDTDGTRDYLGIEGDDGGSGTGGLAPGFGALTAALALAIVAATLVARRRD